MGLESVAVRGPSGDWETLDPCTVEAAAVITHGRTAVTDGPTASSCALTIIAPALPRWRVADEITVHADGRQRFAGRITDLTLTHTAPDTGSEAVLAVTAIGYVADLGARGVGDSPWPAERSRDRATRILIASGVPHRVTGDPPLTVNPRDVDRVTALDLIAELAEDAGAAVFDTPDGTVVVQHFAARAQTWAFLLWQEAPGTWAQASAIADTWAQTAITSETAVAPVVLPCHVAAWEPSWVQTSGQVINHVTIGYGVPPEGADPAAYTTSDPASMTRFGRQHYGKQTQLADMQSAAYRAGLILDRNATPRWAMSGLDLYPDDMTPELAADVLALLCGDRVHVTGLPQPAPASSAVGVVEGWTHTLGPGVNVLTLNLSDPLHSYAGITWGALPPAGTVPPLRWQDVNPERVWHDALTIAQLLT